MGNRFLLSLVVCLVAFASPSFADSIGKIVGLAGAPTSAGPGGNRTLTVGSDVFEHDTITVSTGDAQILFVDGTRLVVGPGSSLLVEKFLLRGGTSTAENVSINALRGTFRFITGKSPKDAYDIKTANATIGVRGTGFDFWVNDYTDLAVLKGLVELCDSKHKKGIACVLLHPTCEMGSTEHKQAKKLLDEIKGTRLRSHLPYVVNQTPLRKDFRLDLASCKSALAGGIINTPTGHGLPPTPPGCGRKCE